MTVVSQTKFAEMTGRSRQAISQRVKAGSLIALANRKIDTEDKINASFLIEVKEDNEIKNGSVENFNNSNVSGVDDPARPIDILSKNATEAKRGQEVLKYKKLEIEVKVLQGELVRKDLVADACFGYLSALNINIMETPQSFLDELEGVIINKGSRLVKMEIVTKPICSAIEQAIKQITKTLREKNDN